jgi:transcriptional regulator with XRE-family HTH domain
MHGMAAQVAAEIDWIPEDSFRGLNIKEAADLCGISPETWRRWEDGSSPRDLESVCAQIHRATGLDYRWLIGGGPLRTGSFSSVLFGLDAVPGQTTFLDDDLNPLPIYERAELALV